MGEFLFFLFFQSMMWTSVVAAVGGRRGVQGMRPVTRGCGTQDTPEFRTDLKKRLEKAMVEVTMFLAEDTELVDKVIARMHGFEDVDAFRQEKSPPHLGAMRSLVKPPSCLLSNVSAPGSEIFSGN